jgi:glycerol transport system permease protein
MARVLTIAVLLRFMDSFMIFTEPFAVIAGGDPVFHTTQLSQTVELGQRAAMSIIYFLIILLLSWVFYTVMTRDDGEPTQSGAKP